MSNDLLSKCRTCLSDSNFFYQLLESVENYKILEMLEGIVPQIDIKCNDQFSTLICQMCVYKLLMSYKFQQLCIETNCRLHDLLKIASFETDPKLENVLDPLSEETNSKKEQKIEKDICYEQKFTLTELDVSTMTDNDNDTKDDKIETSGIENNTKKNEPSVCVKGEYEITPQILKGTIVEAETNGELFSDNETDKSLFVEPVKSTKDVDFMDTRITKIKKKCGNCPCKECGKVFSNIYNLKRHSLMHSAKVSNSDNIDGDMAEKGKLNISNKDRCTHACDVCGRVFRRVFALKRHISIHSANDLNIDVIHTDMDKINKIEKPKASRISRNYPCEVCGNAFSSASCLKRHSSVHSPSRPHECKICNYRFVSLNALNGHLYQHEMGTLDNWKSFTRPDGYKCPDCPRRFEKHASLSSHRRIHNHYGYYPCMICQKYFTAVRSLTDHITRKHPELEKHKCNRCEKTFVLHALLVEHLNRHKGNKIVVCLICEAEFGSTNELGDHMRTHSGYPNSLSDQRRTSSSESLYLCPHCGKTFSKDPHLRQHLKRHSELKEYQCTECPKRFSCRNNLLKHTQIHTNIKPHVCDVCGARFTVSSSMRKHKLTHSGERPFKCDQCSKTFSNSYALKRHMLTHTGEKPYKCKYCERAYAQSGDLAKHLRTHVGENIYMCDQCPMTFKYQAELNQHQSEHYKKAQQQTKQGQQISAA